MIDVRDIEEILEDFDLYTYNDPDRLTSIDVTVIAATIHEKMIHEFQKSQPKTVTCASCGKPLSFGKFFDPLLQDMTVIVNRCDNCGGS